jgi:hypothetical protein
LLLLPADKRYYRELIYRYTRDADLVNYQQGIGECEPVFNMGYQPGGFLKVA